MMPPGNFAVSFCPHQDPSPSNFLRCRRWGCGEGRASVHGQARGSRGVSVVFVVLVAFAGVQGLCGLCRSLIDCRNFRQKLVQRFDSNFVSPLLYRYYNGRLTNHQRSSGSVEATDDHEQEYAKQGRGGGGGGGGGGVDDDAGGGTTRRLRPRRFSFKNFLRKPLRKLLTQISHI